MNDHMNIYIYIYICVCDLTWRGRNLTEPPITLLAVSDSKSWQRERGPACKCAIQGIYTCHADQPFRISNSLEMISCAFENCKSLGKSEQITRKTLVSLSTSLISILRSSPTRLPPLVQDSWSWFQGLPTSFLSPSIFQAAVYHLKICLKTLHILECASFCIFGRFLVTVVTRDFQPRPLGLLLSVRWVHNPSGPLQATTITSCHLGCPHMRRPDWNSCAWKSMASSDIRCSWLCNLQRCQNYLIGGLMLPLIGVVCDLLSSTLNTPES